MIQYKTIVKEAQAEQIIEKSRFIAYVKPVETKEEADAFIAKIKTEHKAATHNVPAFVLGDQFQLQWASDDGEPQGTSGAPMVQMLVKEGITNVVVVVTRYFGGVKLGAGGLVRAYTKGAKVGLEAAKIIEKVMYKEVKIKVDYNQLGKVQNEIMNLGYFIKDTLYTDEVEIIVYAKLDDVEPLTTRMIDITSATANITLGEEFYLSEQNGQIIL